ncbi:MAG: aminoglycoside N(3)-acetyltransferase [Candidatus Lokiarchaeota archaeon]|nr:aminoglycoside N(3)-acetyltransferase [Candidatus Lokiarchaeota archaeon]
MVYNRKKETEKSVVNSTTEPNTITSLKHDFKALGVKQGANVILHVSLSKIGWIIGGSVALLKALMETLTEEGTLVIPTFTGDNSDPSYWENPPVPKSWWEKIRKEMPAFEPEITPSRGIGKVAETFRSWPGVLRSNHPIASFAAWGKNANFITENHELEIDLGEGSPISRLYDLDGQILLIGVSHINNSSLHLAEYRSDFPGKRRRMTGSAVKVDNRNQWVEWEELDINSDDFDRLGKDFELMTNYNPGKIGLAESRLISVREIVDFGVEWLKKNRKAP